MLHNAEESYLKNVNRKVMCSGHEATVDTGVRPSVLSLCFIDEKNSSRDIQLLNNSNASSSQACVLICQGCLQSLVYSLFVMGRNDASYTSFSLITKFHYIAVGFVLQDIH